MGALAMPLASVKDYLAAERTAEFRSEYHDGVVIPMTRVSVAHTIISANTGACLHAALRRSPCTLHIGPWVRVSPTRYFYPDLAVVCGEVELASDSSDEIVNPRVVIEILSPTTADFDRGWESALYRKLPSLQEYVVIAQDEPEVEVLRRAAHGCSSPPIRDSRRWPNSSPSTRSFRWRTSTSASSSRLPSESRRRAPNQLTCAGTSAIRRPSAYSPSNRSMNAAMAARRSSLTGEHGAANTSSHRPSAAAAHLIPGK